MNKLYKLIIIVLLALCQISVTSCNKKDQILPIDNSQQLPKGSLSGIFEIGETKQVRFSQGNLIYCLDGEHLSLEGQQQGTWKFRNRQYDPSISEDEIIDQFRYGTSGYNNYLPTITLDYYNYPNHDPWHDWGVFNAIENGGNRPNMWRTLTAEEWDYLLSNQMYGFAKIIAFLDLAEEDYPTGIVILPKQFKMPEGLTFNTHIQHNKKNIFTLDDWNQMESMGAVFIQNGQYWCFMNNADSCEKYIEITEDRIEINELVDYYSKKKVRLVQDTK